jgi:hypothetical protein
MRLQIGSPESRQADTRRQSGIQAAIPHSCHEPVDGELLIWGHFLDFAICYDALSCVI